MSMNTVFAVAWVAVCLAVIAVAWCTASYHMNSTNRFVEGGYSECQLLGSQRTYWCKDGNGSN